MSESATVTSLRRVESFRNALPAYGLDLHVEEEMPIVTSSDPARGYHLIDTAVAVVPLPDREVLEVGGRDHRKVLQGLLSNDVERLEPGQGCLAALLTDKGKMQTDIRIAAREASLWLEVPYEKARWLGAEFEKYVFREKVSLAAHADEQCALLLAGPKTEDVLESLGLAMPPEKWGWGRGKLGGLVVQITRSDWLADGSAVTLWVATESLESALRQLVEAAREQGGDIAGFHSLELARLDAGVPRFPHDLDEGTIPLEAPAVDMIDFEKGCYLGQEIIARVDARGAVNRHMVAFDVHTTGVPDRGTELVVPEGEDKAGKSIGELTTVARIPAHGTRALGWIRRGWQEPGTRVDLADGSGHVVVRQLAAT